MEGVDPMWTNDPTMTLVSFLRGSALDRAIAAFKGYGLDGLKRFVDTEIEVGQSAPILAQLLLKTSFHNVQWDVITNYVKLKSELAIVHN